MLIIYIKLTNFNPATFKMDKMSALKLFLLVVVFGSIQSPMPNRSERQHLANVRDLFSEFQTLLQQIDRYFSSNGLSSFTSSQNITASVRDQLIYYLTRLQIVLRRLQRMRYELQEDQFQTLETSGLANGE